MTPEQEEKVNSVVDTLKQNISQVISAGEECGYEISGVDKFAFAYENKDIDRVSVRLNSSGKREFILDKPYG